MRLIKQLFFGTLFFTFVLSISFAIWYFTTDRPNCADGIKNGGEEGIDCGLLACGAPCPPPIIDLEVKNIRLLKIIENEHDFIAQVYNPNATYGASDIYYDLIIKDDSGTEVYSESKTFYVLPGQTKYLIVPAMRGLSGSLDADLKIRQANWQSYNPVGTVKFPLTSQERQQNQTGSQFFGVIRNDSDFDFDSVEVRVVVRDGNGQVIAVNVSPVLTLRAHTERHFLVSWPYIIPNFQNATVEVESDTNLFKNSNFLRVYGENRDQFQKFY